MSEACHVSLADLSEKSLHLEGRLTLEGREVFLERSRLVNGRPGNAECSFCCTMHGSLSLTCIHMIMIDKPGVWSPKYKNSITSTKLSAFLCKRSVRGTISFAAGLARA